MIRQSIVLLLLFAFAPAALARSGGHKVESIGALTAAQISEAVRGALEAKGLRVMAEDGKPICEVWFRKEVPTAKADIPGANFGQIPEGTFLGVINFPASITDFRGQGIKAGYYTLRYALILNDGNHLGVSPARDFFLLCPVTEDKNPDVQLKPEDTIKLSRNAAGTGHPSPWYLTTATATDGLPRVVKNDQEHVILEVNLNTKSGLLPVGLTLIGKTEG
jgi:hypothetical protein